MKKLHFYLIPFISVLFLASCEDPDASPKALLNLILVDSPAKWDSVLVEIEGVDIEVLTDGRDTQTQTFFLEYKSGDKKIKISDLVGSNALLLGRSELPIGQIISAKASGVDQYLPSSYSGFSFAHLCNAELGFLNASLNVEQGYSYDIILDMDLEKSIVQVSESPLKYELDPTFTLIDGAGTVDISGVLKPLTLYPAIYLSNGVDTISTHTDDTGKYLFRVPAGSYKIFFDAKDELYLDTAYLQDLVVSEDSLLRPIIFKKRP